MDYFEVFGLERKLEIDTAALQDRFYKLSREFHPDRFTLRPPADQQNALEMTSLLNDGLRVLRDPVRRAEYVLSQRGFDISTQRTKDVPPELLEEVFELNMALEESDKGQLDQFRSRFQSMLAGIDGGLAKLFAAHDAVTGDEKAQAVALNDIRAVLNRRRYIENLVQKIEASS